MIDFSVNANVFAQNFVWAAFSWMVALVYGVYLWTGRKDIMTDARSQRLYAMTAGVFMVAFASGVHRTWWAMWRWYLSWGDKESALFIQQNADWLSTGVVIICIGYLFHLLPLSHSLFRRLWLIAPAGGGIVLYLLSANLAGPH